MPVRYTTDENYHPSGIEGAGEGASEGSAFGPYGALGGAIGGYLDNQFFGGTAYKLLHGPKVTAVEPTWVDIDPNALQQAGVAADQKAYDLSDREWAARNPDLARGKQAAIDSSIAEMNGSNKAITAALESAGLHSEGQVFDQVGGRETQEQQSRHLGLSIPALGERSRNYFQQMLSGEKRAFGLSGEDVVNIRVANAKQDNVNSETLFRSRLAQQNADSAQYGQDLAALGTAVSSGFSQAIKDYYRTASQRQASDGTQATWTGY